MIHDSSSHQQRHHSSLTSPLFIICGIIEVLLPLTPKKIYSLSFSCRSQAPWTWHGRSVTVLPYRETWLHAFLAFSGSFLDPSRSTSRSRHVLVGGRKTANGSIRWRLCFLRPHRERTNNPVAFLFPSTPRLGVWPLLYHVSSG